MKTGFERIGRTVTIEHAHRSCLDKVGYSNRNDARDNAAKIARKFKSKPMRPYRCTLCGGFHLTRSIPSGLRKGKPRTETGPARKAA